MAVASEKCAQYCLTLVASGNRNESLLVSNAFTSRQNAHVLSVDNLMQTIEADVRADQQKQQRMRPNSQSDCGVLKIWMIGSTMMQRRRTAEVPELYLHIYDV